MKNWSGQGALNKAVRVFIKKQRRLKRVQLGYKNKTNSLM